MPRLCRTASQGSAYNQIVTASGGTGPYVLALISGALPAGLSLNRSHRRDYGHADRQRSFHVHDPGDRRQREHRHANLYRQRWRQLPDHQSGHAAGGAQGQSLQPGAWRGRRIRSLTVSPCNLARCRRACRSTPADKSRARRPAKAASRSRCGSPTAAAVSARAPIRLPRFAALPPSDPEVRGLVAAQAASARRFTDTQTSNVLRRLESLHDNFNPCGLNFGINPSTYSPPPAYPFDPATGSAFPPVSKDPLPPLRPATSLSRCDGMTGPPIAVWASGSLEFGKVTNRSARSIPPSSRRRG